MVHKLLFAVLVLLVIATGCDAEQREKIGAADMAVSLTSQAFGYELKHEYTQMVVTKRSDTEFVVSGPATRTGDGKIFRIVSVVTVEGNRYELKEATVDRVKIY